MRLWLSKNSDVPVREQLVSQIIIGVSSDDLQPGQKLPSTRELARRFGIHSNTVSAAYRHWAGRGWVELCWWVSLMKSRVMSSPRREGAKYITLYLLQRPHLYFPMSFTQRNPV